MKYFAQILAKKNFLSKLAILQKEKARPRAVSCFARGDTGCERSEAGVWIPASMASALSTADLADLFGKPLMEAVGSHALKVPASILAGSS